MIASASRMSVVSPPYHNGVKPRRAPALDQPVEQRGPRGAVQEQRTVGAGIDAGLCEALPVVKAYGSTPIFQVASGALAKVPHTPRA